MCKCKLRSCEVESQSKKTFFNKKNRKWESNETSVKRSIGCCTIDLIESLIKVLLVLGFVISMCTLSCSVQKISLGNVKEDVEDCQEDIKNLKKTFEQFNVGVTNSCENAASCNK